MHNLEKWTEQYIMACEYQKGLDSKTLKAYRIDLAQFTQIVKQENLDFTREGIMVYISRLHQTYQPRTIRRKIASIKAFFNYLEYEELLNCNPFDKLKIKLNAPLILLRTIPLTTIEAILTAAYRLKEESRGKRDTPLRDIAVLEMLFATGIRVSELCSLKYSDVRLNEGEIKIYGKGAKERFVQIANSAVLQALVDYRKV